MAPRKLSLWLAAAAAAAVLVRVLGLTWGLPHTFNADEPHLVNLAVSFGGGSLKPYAFKYPTLWPYVLFIAYGFYFALWSCLGLCRGVADFIGLYAWHPTGFYLIGRALAAAAGLGGLWVLARHERSRAGGGPPWAALLLAFSPTLVELAHSLKPDGLMFLFACLGWTSALRVLEDGDARAHRLCGLFFGLAMSAQYTALPAALALPLAHVLSKRRPPPQRLAEGVLACAAGFFAGSPYVLLDFPRFWAGLRDLGALGSLEIWDRSLGLRFVLANLGHVAGPGSIAGAAALAGLYRLWHRERGRALTLAVPIGLYAALLANNPDGGWPRYLLGAYPALALLAAEGLRWAAQGRRAHWTAALAVLALVPGLVCSLELSLDMTRPDTREEARAWVASHVPPGGVILLDLPHASPDLAMEKEQVEELAARTAAAGSPRARLYRGMAATHPGGGWRLYRIARTARDLRSSPAHVSASSADWPTLDVGEGLAAARAAKVGIVITSSFGANPERAWELKGFFAELERRGALLATFWPRAGETEGPVLRVFRLPRI